MAILEILQYPDLRLRRHGYRVGNTKAVKIQKIIKDMFATLKQQERCAGLAATQLDIDDPPHITVIKYPIASSEENIICLINLEILTLEGVILEEEGCMSIQPRKFSAEIKRATKITARALNQYGEKVEFTATDHLARCLQHEHDHLRGVLFIDYLDQKEHLRLKKQLAEL